mmetsp:Transcript_14721/g.44927  ORF Transcript_14721/g.44927 Transcript_14721/m.44927 type:complete len:101 (+) Transcript_14721:384-686(+)
MQPSVTEPRVTGVRAPRTVALFAAGDFSRVLVILGFLPLRTPDDFMQSSGPCEQHANYEAQDARAQATGDELPPLLRILCVSFWSLTERDRNDASHGKSW